MKKRLLAMLLALTMAIGLLAGCGTTTPDAPAEEGLPKDNPEENITISVWQYSQDYKYYTSYNDNPVVQYMNEKFNIKLEYEMPPLGSESENFNLMLSTGEYTDLINTTYSTDSLSTLYEDGVIVDIAPYIEQYMPNYYKLIQENEGLRKMVYDDEGRAYGMYLVEAADRAQWGGMLYRHDIVETMTGGNVAFPSGNAVPTTVEDWDYMLPLMKTYFEYTGIAETACLIIPACGYITTGELINGFGTSGSFQLNADKTAAEFGPATKQFYNYLVKMNEWYKAGYIYQDFASRTNDLFYLPNTSLTYGGAAGAWFGLQSQLGTAMSLPEYGLNMNVVGVSGPLDTANGVTEAEASFHVYGGDASSPWCISTACDVSKYERIFTFIDYLYSEEGSMTKKHGLTAEQAVGNALYTEFGLEDGRYWIDENGDFYMNEKFFDQELGLDGGSFAGNLMPGKDRADATVVNDPNTANIEAQKAGQAAWAAYGKDRNFPTSATLNTEESAKFNAVYPNIVDYVNSMVPKFIMGTEELNEESFQAFVDAIYKLGLQDALDAYNSALARYQAR